MIIDYQKVKLKLRHVNSLSLLVLLITGCGNFFETVYLRQAEVTGPIVTSPIHLADSSFAPSLTVSPSFTYNTGNSFTGNVKEFTTLFDLDSAFIPSDHSLLWNITIVSMAIDLDYRVSKNFAISCGAFYSTNSNFNSWGGNIGVGFVEIIYSSAFRIDIGVQIHTMQYNTYSVLGKGVASYSGPLYDYIGFFHDVGKDTHIDPYVSLTYNTVYKNWPFNIFFNAGYSVQTLFHFEPKTPYYNFFGDYTPTDERGSSTAGFINLTPGVYFLLGESSRLLIGSRFYFETQIQDADPKLFIMPMVQFDFRL
ncbi:MAG: hypothetical protein JSW63_01015 [Ignavibacterium sp.]|nr:MAG: hypothetical protein JSW63_01015 [Ignavibacterium sp.]